jgi:hypothetical protein
MKDKFANWKIDLKWVKLLPHVDDFNSRHSGQNFLGSVSRTVAKEGSSMDSLVGYVTMVRQTLTFCQRKVLEDAVVCEECARTIRDGIKKWCDNLPEHRTDHGIESFSWSIH